MVPPVPRRPRSRALAVLSSTAVVLAGLVALTAPAQAANTDIRINEIESSGGVGATGAAADWIELTNVGTAAIDISGWILKDNVDTDKYVIAAGTVLAPGAYAVFDTDQPNSTAPDRFGLGGADSARLFLPDNSTLVDTYTWTVAADPTYGRCPNGTGPIVTTAASTRGAANVCPPPTSPVKLNEVESDDGAPGDWVELLNTGTTAVDVGGYVFRDSGDAPSGYTIPTGTSIAAGGYLVLDQDATGAKGFTFGLGGGDSARLYLPGETTPYDTYAWTAHATTTYGRCPNGTGAFTTTTSPTKGGPNSCAGDLVAGPWPGGSAVTTVDSAALQSQVTSNLSGLYYENTGSTGNPGTLWAVRNGAGTLYKLQKQASTWGPAAGDWASGKTLRYTAPDTTGDPDAEGVTLTDAGAAGGVYVSTERNNAVSGTSRPAILRFEPETAGTTLNATRDYNLTADLPTLGANLGLEGIAWVPDSSLVASGFKDQRTNAPYNPATYANHGTGLFFVGVEQSGMVYAYALTQGADTYTRVASFATGFPAVMELTWEADTQKLWVTCDDTCQGRSSRFAVNGSGFFAPAPYVERPAGMPNINNEGFAVTPDTECVSGLKPVYWADDNDTAGFSLRQGSLSCATSPAPPSTTPTKGTTPATGATPPTTVADRTGPVVKLEGARNGGFYRGRSPRLTCSATDLGGVVTCVVRTKTQRISPTRTLVTARALATDVAGNTSVRRKTFVLARR
jgi:hypothetical protein